MDLEKFEEAVVGRELRMIELEKEVAALKGALERSGNLESSSPITPPSLAARTQSQ